MNYTDWELVIKFCNHPDSRYWKLWDYENEQTYKRWEFRLFIVSIIIWIEV